VDSRFFLEVFTNTLLLGRVDPSTRVPLDPPDIQSGFYVLPSSVIEQLTFEYVADYGGELALFYQLWRAGSSTENLDYRPRARKASAYRLRQIYEQVMALPFFRDVTEEESEHARRRAPVLYRRYFDEKRLAAYEEEMPRILARP
jgi:hypothetical protein